MPGFSLVEAANKRVTDAVDIENNAQGQVAYTAAANQSAALPEGIYDVWSDVNCYIKVAPTANDVTIATGYLLLAGNVVPILVRQNSKIGAVGAGAGTLSYHKVG